MKVGHQGIKGAFSYIATKELYPSAEIVSYRTFLDVLDAVESGAVEYGVIPMENSSAGRVADVYNIFKQTKLYIVAEKLLKVQHNLASIYGAKIENITHIFSHEQALRQCEKTLQKLAPTATLVAKENTAISAEYVKSENNLHFACVCSADAIAENHLSLLQANIQDNDNNSTLFVVFAKKPITIAKNTQNVKTSIIFEIKNEVGSLYHSLGCFANNNIDLIKLESYIPNAFASTSAMFFTTMKGNIADDNMQKALQELKNYTKQIHIFGSYFEDIKN